MELETVIWMCSLSMNVYETLKIWYPQQSFFYQRISGYMNEKSILWSNKEIYHFQMVKSLNWQAQFIHVLSVSFFWSNIQKMSWSKSNLVRVLGILSLLMRCGQHGVLCWNKLCLLPNPLQLLVNKILFKVN